jgi:putative addiction module antidote
MQNVVIRSIGSSNGIILSRTILNKLNCVKGDKLFITETKNGIELSPYNKEFAEDLETVDLIISRNKNLLNKLSK